MSKRTKKLWLENLSKGCKSKFDWFHTRRQTSYLETRTSKGQFFRQTKSSQTVLFLTGIRSFCVKFSVAPSVCSKITTQLYWESARLGWSGPLSSWVRRNVNRTRKWSRSKRAKKWVHTKPGKIRGPLAADCLCGELKPVASTNCVHVWGPSSACVHIYHVI